jgi:putative ABC transport system permease protein
MLLPGRKPPRKQGLPLLIVVSLGMGIAALSTVGGIVHAVLLRTLPFADPERLVLIGETTAPGPQGWESASYPDFLDWQAQCHSFTALAASRARDAVLRLPAGAVHVDGADVSARFVPLLRLRPALGRLLGPGDFRPGAEPVAVLSRRLWMQRFGGDARVLGRPIVLDGTAATVVGVLPEETPLDEPVVIGNADLLRPLLVPPGSSFAGRGFRAVRVLGALREGVGRRQAAAEMEQIGRRLEAAHPENKDLRLRVESLREVTVAGSRPVLLALLGAAALLLLIACVNAASARLVDLGVRRRDFAVRNALGAQRRHLFRQLLWESLPLAGMGFLLGLLLTLWVWDVFVALLPPSIAHLTGLGLDARVVAVTALVSLLALALVDLLPFLEVTRLSLPTLLSQGPARAGEAPASRRSRNVLVAAEIALTLALLIGAGLLVRSLSRLSRVELGFRPERVLALDLDLGSVGINDPRRAGAFFAPLLRSLDGRRDLRSAAVVVSLPLQTGGNLKTGLGLRPNSLLGWQIDLNGVSPGYFATLGIPLLRGRDFSPRETADDPSPVVILSASAARRLWGREEPVGKRVILDGIGTGPHEVIGVVGDVREASPATPPHPEAYLPYPQIFFGTAHLVVRTAGDPRPMADIVRGEIRALDRNLPIGDAATLEQLAAARVASPATDARILGAFALTGLILATLGVYGVTSFAVAQRRHELGLRIALGAPGSNVIRMILLASARWITLGLLLGLAGGAVLSRLFAGLLYEIAPLDPWTFLAMPLFLLAVALWAAYVPARRAARLDPVAALAEP